MIRWLRPRLYRCRTCPGAPRFLSWRLHRRTARHRAAVTRRWTPPLRPAHPSAWLTAALASPPAPTGPAPARCAPPWRAVAPWGWEARCPHTGVLVDASNDRTPPRPPRVHLHAPNPVPSSVDARVRLIETLRAAQGRVTQRPGRTVRNTPTEGAPRA